MSDLDLARDVLDCELVDSDGVACGRVDNVDLQSGPDGALCVRALLVGPGALAPRLPALLQRLLELGGTRKQVSVPWSEVERIEGVVRLRRRAAELELGRLNRKLGRWLSRLPMS